MKMNILKHITILLVAASLVGCFPASPQALRQDASARQTIEVSDGYQAVYRKVSNKLRCNESMWIGDATRVRADLFTDIQRAEIALEGSNLLLGKRVELLIEITSTGEKSTRVEVFVPFGKKVAWPVKEWIESSSADC